MGILLEEGFLGQLAIVLSKSVLRLADLVGNRVVIRRGRQADFVVDEVEAIGKELFGRTGGIKFGRRGDHVDLVRQRGARAHRALLHGLFCCLRFADDQGGGVNRHCEVEYTKEQVVREGMANNNCRSVSKSVFTIGAPFFG